MPTSIDKSAGQSLLTNLVGLAVDTYRISVGVGRSEEKEARIIGPPIVYQIQLFHQQPKQFASDQLPPTPMYQIVSDPNHYQ